MNKAASGWVDELATPRALQKAMARQAGTDAPACGPDPLLDPAVQALGSTVPDSGTAGRLAMGGGAGGAVALDPASALLTGLGTWAGTKAALQQAGGEHP